MKRKAAVLAAMALLLTACGNASAPTEQETVKPVETEAEETTKLTLCVFPVGGWGNSGTVSSLLSEFYQEHPDIRVTVKTVDYVTGDDEIEKMIADGEAPDLILEGPERLVANWGARGLMEDLSDLWQEGMSEDIYENVEVACHDAEGRYWIYPLCMTTHCMAVNRDLFEAAGAWQYIDEETRTWSTDDFIAAVAALRDYGVENVGAVYCAGQGGDQGTRALVNNLYSGTFTDPEHTKYTVDSPENVRALELLAGMDGIAFAPDLVGTDEIERFVNKELAMSFCWNVFIEINQTIGTDLDFDIFPMAFPTDDGEANLQGGIWGFGIFDNGDSERTEAAKTFIRYMTDGEEQYRRAVLTSTYWPVRDIPDLYANDRLMNEYSIFQQYLGDYYQITPGWAEARTAWWNMLKRIGAGEDAAKAVEEFSTEANAAAAAAARQ